MPTVAVTLGDPTGVGPEITVKAIASGKFDRLARIIVIGSPQAVRLACIQAGLHLQVVPIADLAEVPYPEQFAPASGPQKADQRIFVLPAGPDDWGNSIEPTVHPRGGEAAYESLVMATKLALKGGRAGGVDAIVTSPLHKVALYQAGHNWPGHTELLAHLCGVEEHAMMLYLPPADESSSADKLHASRLGPAGLGVVHVTLHMALRDVFANLTTTSIDEKIRLADSVFRRIRAALRLPLNPKIAVAALNPHCGEGGRFGDEESTTISPAVLQSQANGIDVVGPLAVDTLMPKAVAGDFDAVVAMYHDQGHIALKLLDMFDAVNITLGIPIVRTSVAHGTAHDIAWKNQARESGMIQAILTAIRLKGVVND